MFKELMKVHRFFWSAHWGQALVWLVFHSAVLVFFHYFDGLMGQGKLSSRPYGWRIWIVFLLGFSQFTWVVCVHILLRMKYKTKWSHRLPLDRTSTYVYGQLLIFLAGLITIWVAPWGVYLTGLSFYNLALPMLVFAALQWGRLCGFSLFFVLQVFTYGSAILSGMYIYKYSGWQIELSIIIATAILLMVLRGRRALQNVPIVIVSLLTLLLSCVYTTFHVPQTYGQATTEYFYFPSSWKWKQYKHVALESNTWIDYSYHLPSVVGIQAQIINEKLSPEEREQMITQAFGPTAAKSIGRPEVVGDREEGQRSVRLYEDWASFPFYREDTTEKQEALLMALAEKFDKIPYARSAFDTCMLFPLKSTQLHAQVAIKNRCLSTSTNSLFWHLYSLTEEGEFEKAILAEVEMNGERRSPQFDQTSLRMLQLQWGYPRDIAEKKPPMNVTELRKVNGLRYESTVKMFKNSPVNPESFVPVFIGLWKQGEMSQLVFEEVCSYVIGDCDYRRFKAEYEAPIWKSIKTRLKSPSRRPYNSVWFEKEVRKPQYQERIASLVQFINKRKLELYGADPFPKGPVPPLAL